MSQETDTAILRGRTAATVQRGLTARWAIALVLAVAAVVIMWAGRQITFMADEWRWIFGGLHLNADQILRDDNGHLLATTQGIYNALLRTVGLGDYWVYRAVALLLALAIALLVFLLARRRLGPWLAVAPAAVVAFLGTGADAFLSAINIGLLLATTACVAALLLLDRRTRRGDLVACALLVVGLASWTSAVAYTGGVFVEILWQRDRWRRIWVPLIPAGLYIAWKLNWGGSLLGDVHTAGNSPGGVVDVAKHGLQAAAGAIAGLGGLQLNSSTLKAHVPWLATLAQVAVVLGLALLVWLLVRRARASARLANLLVSASVLWLLLALGRGSLGDLYASRYVYVGAIVAVLIMVELASGNEVRSRSAARLVALAAAVSVAFNVAWMVVWGNHLRDESSVGRSQLAALDIAAGRAPPLLKPSSYALQGVTVRDYLEAVRRFGGSPAYTTSQLRRASERAREAADEVLVPALAVRLASSRQPAREPAPGVGSAKALRALKALFDRLGRLPAQRIVAPGDCVTLAPRAGLAVADTAPGFTSLVVSSTRPGSPLAIQARRFGDRYAAVVGAQRGGTAALPAPPLGGAPDAWQVRVISTAPARICARR